VEREVQVHPDGQQISFTTGRLLAGENQTLEIQVPPTAIPDSMDAELRIYPNLIAHVSRRHGMASPRGPQAAPEQITSIGYVSLQGFAIAEEGQVSMLPPKDSRAQMYAGSAQIRAGRLRVVALLAASPNGGFSYWGQHFTRRGVEPHMC